MGGGWKKEIERNSGKQGGSPLKQRATTQPPPWIALLSCKIGSTWYGVVASALDSRTEHYFARLGIIFILHFSLLCPSCPFPTPLSPASHCTIDPSSDVSPARRRIGRSWTLAARMHAGACACAPFSMHFSFPPFHESPCLLHSSLFHMLTRPLDKAY